MSTKRPTALLFDIDGTLVDTGGAGRRAMERAFTAQGGSPSALKDVPFAGMTDWAILRAGFERSGEEVAEARVSAVLALYLTLLEEELVRSERYRVFAGVAAALDAAAARSECAVGLGTGNVKHGARLKLDKGGLYDRFAFGGFGCDHEDRATLLAIGAERGAQLLGVAVSACRIVVIGDTPRDVAAAFAIGAECVAVATGSFSVDQLAETGASWVFRDLGCEGAIEAILG